MATLLDDDARLLVGVDLVKEPAMIELAYNDAAGATSAFNRNVLTVINRELGADLPSTSTSTSRSSTASSSGSTSGYARRVTTS